MQNWQIVAEAIRPLLLLFVVIAGVLLAMAAIALTPGELVEHLSRPLIAALLGAVGGGFVALCAVALGFGGYFKPRAYIFVGDQVEAVDGDTFRVGDVPLRLNGIDALELDQRCVGERADCGVGASEHLVTLVRGAVLVCNRPDDTEIVSKEVMPPEESFGRPLVNCDVLASEGAFDLGERMESDGFAVDYVPADDHVPGFFLFNGGCSALPRDWRRMNSDERSAFAAAGDCVP